MVDTQLLIQSLKTIFKVAKAGNNLDITERIIEAQGQALDLQAELLELRNRNAELERKLADDAKWKERAKGFTYRLNGMWEGEEGPFCSRCFEVENKAVHAVITGAAQYVCPSCKTEFELMGR